MADVAYTSHNAHFLSNHDEPRAVAKFNNEWYKADAAALITYTLPGMRFFWEGQLEGYQYELAVQLRRERPSPPISNVTTFYNRLLEIVAEPVFRSGNWTFIWNSNANLITYRWHLQEPHGGAPQRRLCVFNFGPNKEWDTIKLPDATPAPNGNDTVPVTDLLSGTIYYRSAAEMRNQGLVVGINSWWGQILQY